VLGIGYINLPNLEPMGWAKPQHIVIERSRELEDEHKARGPLSRLNPADINSRSDLTAGVVAHAAPRLANLEE
jgi:hypothetical protein